MNESIVKDVVLDIINRKIEILREQGVFAATYPELLSRLNRLGYNDESEIQVAIAKLVNDKQLKCGKYADKTGWLRDFRNMDKQ